MSASIDTQVIEMKKFEMRKQTALWRIKHGQRTMDDYDEEWRSKRGKKRTSPPETLEFKNPEEKNAYHSRKSIATKNIKEGVYTAADYDEYWYLKKGKRSISTKDTRTKKRNEKALQVRMWYAKKRIEEGKATRDDFDEDWYAIYKNVTPEKKLITCRKRHAQKKISQGVYTADDYDENWYIKKGHVAIDKKIHGKNNELIIDIKTDINPNILPALWELLARDDPSIIAPPPEFA